MVWRGHSTCIVAGYEEGKGLVKHVRLKYVGDYFQLCFLMFQADVAVCSSLLQSNCKEGYEACVGESEE